MKKMLNKIKNLNLFILIMLSSFILSSIAYASDMESPRFRIESGTIDFDISESTESTSKNVNLDKDAELFKKEGILIKTDGGSTQGSPFRLTIDNSLLTIRDVSPNSPSEVATDITISGGRSIYQLSIDETDQMRKLSGEVISDTSCNPSKKCTPYVAATWDSLSAFGFGYSIRGDDVASDFKNKNYFRPFVNRKNSMKEAVIMKNTNKLTERRAKLNIKANLSAVQPDGNYQTVVAIYALPGY